MLRITLEYNQGRPSPIFNYAYCILTPIAEKMLHSHLFSLFLIFLASPTLTMMHLPIVLYTYWVPLNITLKATFMILLTA